MLLAVAFLFAAPDVAAVIAAARTTTSVRAAMLLLFSYSAYTFRGGQLTEEVSFLAWQKFFVDPFYFGVVAKTLQLALVVTGAALVIGYPTAYALTKVRSSKLLVAAYIVIFSPLLVSLVVRVYGWLLLLSDNGVINQALLAIGVIAEPVRLIYNEIGVVIALVHILLPFMVFPILSVLLQFDHALREAANDLGATAWQRLRYVTLPILLPGIIGVAMGAFTLSYDEYARTTLVIGERNTLPLEIYALISSATSPTLFAIGTVTTAVSFVIIAMTLWRIFHIQRRRAGALPSQ